MGEAKQDKRFGIRLEVISGKTDVRLYDKEGGVVYERVEKAVRCMARQGSIRDIRTRADSPRRVRSGQGRHATVTNTGLRRRNMNKINKGNVVT